MKRTVCIILVLVIIVTTPMFLYSDIRDLREQYRVQEKEDLTTKQKILKYTGAGLYQLFTTSIFSAILLSAGFMFLISPFIIVDEHRQYSASEQRINNTIIILYLISVPILSLLELRIIAENIHKMFKM
ncbi:MAG: hypothetical protein SVK54_07955 [candidate division WOR-3 bacterium]|nr:hypothetical protein [candidate division WOR-3 bacterium]